MDLKVLIKVSPLRKEVQEEVLRRLPFLSEGEKYRLTFLLWEGIGKELEFQRQLLWQKVLAEKGGNFSPNDWEEVKAKVQYDFREKVEKVLQEEELAKVRQSLSKTKNGKKEKKLLSR